MLPLHEVARTSDCPPREPGERKTMSEEAKKTDERVRIRAYHLWERDGRPLGRNDEYWAKALAEIHAEDRARQAA